MNPLIVPRLAGSRHTLFLPEPDPEPDPEPEPEPIAASVVLSLPPPHARSGANAMPGIAVTRRRLNFAVMAPWMAGGGRNIAAAQRRYLGACITPHLRALRDPRITCEREDTLGRDDPKMRKAAAAERRAAFERWKQRAITSCGGG